MESRQPPPAFTSLSLSISELYRSSSALQHHQPGSLNQLPIQTLLLSSVGGWDRLFGSQLSFPRPISFFDCCLSQSFLHFSSSSLYLLYLSILSAELGKGYSSAFLSVLLLGGRQSSSSSSIGSAWATSRYLKGRKGDQRS